MKEMKRIADTIIEHIETEYDCPSRHPELDHKVPVLDLAVWIEEVAAQGLDVQELHSCCCHDICLPLGEPRAAVQPSHLSLYTTPVHRGCTSGGSIHNCLSDVQLIQPSGSQVQSLQPDAVSALHPTTSCLSPGCHCPLRPCSSASAHSQSQLLAPRTSEDGGQGVGLLPPVTINRPSVQPSDRLQPAKGSLSPRIRMNFRKISERGGGGHFRSEKFHCNFFCIRNGNFGNEFAEKIAMKFSEKGAGGRGQRPFGNFPEIHSNLRRQASLS